ncbi:MAG: TonB-dependent siderophore receptor [Gammaproteobacteria bacterium]|nr:MAG: TonB-dependent siderophore receptor [Gammaproteobacteria bacterium]
MKQIVFAAAISALLNPSLSMAQAYSNENELEEVIVYGQLSRYSALKADTPIMEIARSVSIVTEQQLLDLGAVTLDEVLTYSAGISSAVYGYATRGDWVKVRGLNVPMYQDSLQSLFGNYNNTRPHTYTLEQVEVLKGPASVLYGKGSPGGLINIISKRPQQERAHELQLELGNYEHRQVAVDSTGPIGDSANWFYRMVGVYQHSDTQVDYVGIDKTVLAPSFSWRPSIDTDVTLLLNYSKTDSDTAAQFLPIHGTLYPGPEGRRIDPGVYAGEPDFNQYIAEAKSVTLLASHQFNDVWSMEFTSRYTDAKADYQQAWTSFSVSPDRFIYNPDGFLYKNGLVPRTFYRKDGFSRQAATDVRLRANFASGVLDHEVMMGAQYQDVAIGGSGYYFWALGFASGDDRYWLNLFDPVYGNVPPAQMLNERYAKFPDVDTKDLGFYINDHITVGDLHISLGLRFDKTESETIGATQKDEEFSTSVGLLYQFDNGIAPYVSYAESFDPVIGDNGNGQLLKPEQGEQWELGLKYQPDGLPVLVTLSLFDIEQSNLPDPEAAPNVYEQQSGVTDIEGIEVEATASFGDFRIDVSFTQLDTNTPDGYRLATVSKHQISTWLSYRPEEFWQGFKAAYGLRYVSDAWGGLDRIRTPSYTLMDLMLGYEFGPWDFALNVQNLADKSYYATCLSRGDCFVGATRSVVGRVSYRF